MKRLFVILLITAASAVFSQSESDFQVSAEDGAVTITKYTGSAVNVIIPAMIRGLPVNAIGRGAFRERIGVVSISIPASVTGIGRWVFYGCAGLTNISVDPRNPAYSSRDGVLFNKTSDTLIAYPAAKTGEYVIPESVTSITQDAFAGCTGLSKVSIPSGVTGIGENVFWGCTGLTSVSIPAGVKSIAQDAFSGCARLTSISIGANVTLYKSAGNYVFANGFDAFYNANGKKAGVYTFRNGAWHYAA